MLMDRLVLALNGSTTLVSQGLRTLEFELCVDNLQPDFLYQHIQPVRQDLIQGLWKKLKSSNETIAYRVLGKFGKSNRMMIVQSQQLNYKKSESDGFKILIELSGYVDQLTSSPKSRPKTKYSMAFVNNLRHNHNFAHHHHNHPLHHSKLSIF